LTQIYEKKRGSLNELIRLGNQAKEPVEQERVNNLPID
jgi:hypothetical protein